MLKHIILKAEDGIRAFFEFGFFYGCRKACRKNSQRLCILN